jgi:DNA-binding FadR family transcriptional regulator
VAANLRRQIVRGHLKVGEVLPPEPALLEQFGVSRPGLREAFRILEAESLIHVRRGSGGGARVTPPTLSVALRLVGLVLQMSETTTADVSEARIVLESAIARGVAARHATSDIETLGGTLDAVASTIDGSLDERRSVAELCAVSRDFHHAVVDCGTNKALALNARMLLEIEALHPSTPPESRRRDPKIRRDVALAVRSYRKLITMIEAADQEGAERHWRTHMETARQRMAEYGVVTTSPISLFQEEGSARSVMRTRAAVVQPT